MIFPDREEAPEDSTSNGEQTMSRPKTKKTETPKAPKETGTIAKIVAQILADQEAILAEEASMSANEARIVQSKIAIGRQLLALKAAARQARKKLLECLAPTGYDGRVARRLMRVAKSAWAKNGPNGSVPHDQLPTDLHKLDALAGLDCGRAASSRWS
jgi:hypothetical protein